jgi:threonine/homoserine/homoserine lactone efflux protein
MDIAPSIWSFAAVVALLTITPGLDTALILRTSLLSGRRPAWGVVLGVQVGTLTWGLLTAVGLSTFVPADAPHAAMGLLLAGVHVGEGVLWSAVLVGFAALMSGALRTPAVKRLLDRVTGIVIVAFGIRLAMDS